MVRNEEHSVFDTLECREDSLDESAPVENDERNLQDDEVRVLSNTLCEHSPCTSDNEAQKGW
jgi:hypothetical protein